MGSAFFWSVKPKMKTVYRSSKKKQAKTNLSEQERIDRILDKISASGYDSLTKEEKAVLLKAGKSNTLQIEINEITFSNILGLYQCFVFGVQLMLMGSIPSFLVFPS